MALSHKARQVQSWGRYPVVEPARVVPVYWRHEVPELASFDLPVLPYAYGRSYGDSCLNEGGMVLDVSHLRRLLALLLDWSEKCASAGDCSHSACWHSA